MKNIISCILLIASCLFVINLDAGAQINNDNEYLLYSKAINYIINDFSLKYNESFCEHYYISSIFELDSLHLLKIQNQEAKKLNRFSSELSRKFKLNKKYKNIIPDSIRIDYSYEYLPVIEREKYFYYGARDAWNEFYKNNKIGAIIELSPVIYTKKRDKAAFLVMIYNGGQNKGRGYLVQAKKNNNFEWKIYKAEVFVYIN